MELMNKLLEDAKADRKKIVLPEGNEERTIVAAEQVYKKQLAYPILIGNEKEILDKAMEIDVDLSEIGRASCRERV